MRKGGAALLLGGVLLGFAATAHATTWKVDPAHTTVGFTVSHLFTSVNGRFDRFDGSIDFDPENPQATVVQGTIETASINTNHQKRDTHLRSGDFFDAEKYPTLRFESTGGIHAMNGKRGKLAGNLTIRGVTRPVVLDVTYFGQGSDPWGNVRAGFRATLEINRKDFGLNWNEILETGGVLVGDEVEIRIDAEGMIAE
jgi:polyisoprenoid-binding protein YceI